MEKNKVESLPESIIKVSSLTLQIKYLNVKGEAINQIEENIEG